MKAFAADLKTIYNATSEDEGQKARDRVVEKWSSKYPNSMKRWIENWDVVVPIFKFSVSVEQLVTGKNTLEANIALFPFSIQRIVNDLLQLDESDIPAVTALVSELKKRNSSHSITREDFRRELFALFNQAEKDGKTDSIVYSPPSGAGATLSIRYALPRTYP